MLHIVEVIPSSVATICAGAPARILRMPRGLVAGFLVVDFLFFHDVFKAGEITTVPQYMTGVLSVAVFAVCSRSLLGRRR